MLHRLGSSENCILIGSQEQGSQRTSETSLKPSEESDPHLRPRASGSRRSRKKRAMTTATEPIRDVEEMEGSDAPAPRRKIRGYEQLIGHLRGLLSPSRVEGRLKRFENGSLKAAVQLHCLACCADDIGAIRDCTSQKTCPLHPHRPYQRA